MAALVPVVAGLAAFRWARVSHPAWFAVYGAATGLLLGNFSTDVAMGLLLPAVASIKAETPREGLSPPAPRASLVDHDAQSAYVSDALVSSDPALVVLALKEIGTLRRIPVALDQNPPLGEIMRTVQDLGFDLAVTRSKT